MKNSEALIVIAEKFRQGKCNLGICSELEILANATRISGSQKYDMKKRIYKLLGDNVWLDDWLRKNVEDYDHSDRKKRNETRAQWCEHMAKYWKRKGN